MRYLFLTLLILVSTQQAHSQDFTFKVIGAVFKRYENEKIYSIGQELNQNDTIILKENNYIALITQQDKIFELSKPGIYLVSDLQKEVQKKASITSKMDILFQPEARLPSSRYFNKSGFHYHFHPPSIFFLPHRSKIYKIDKITLSWSKCVRESKKINYIIEVRNDFDEPIITHKTSDTSMVFNFSELKTPKKEEIIMIQFVLKVEILHTEFGTKEVIGKDEKTIIKLYQEELKELKKQYKLFEKAKFNSLIVQKLSEIFLLEENYCPLEAQIIFEELIKYYPLSFILKKCYHLFLFRNGVYADWLEELYPDKE